MKSLDQDNETQLVRRLYARDETAMTHFYTHYKPALYATNWRIVRHDELAEDVLQESMLRFWQTFAAYDSSRGRLFTWALNISRNLAIDYLRAQRKLAQRTTDFPEHEAELAAPTTFRPEHVGVRDWLACLPAADRQVVELLYLQGYTHPEAAAAMQLPLGTLKSRVRRIIRTLARTLR
jgi:RNA polymerase sigma factor (sigma-70 family)